MPSRRAQIRARQQNAQPSTGPKAPEGQESTAPKHGPTGHGTILPEADAAEVDRRSASFARELEAEGDLGHALARRAALNSVRMERAADQQSAALSEKIRRVQAEFAAPEGTTPAEADRLRSEACRRAMFDASPEATLARRYEQSAERSFFRAIKELRQLQRSAKALDPAAQDRAFREELASFIAEGAKLDARLDKFEAEMGLEPLPMPSRARSTPFAARPSASPDAFELPFSIGQPR